MLEEQCRAEGTLEVHCDQKHAVIQRLLIHPATWQGHRSMNTARLPTANLVVETILVEVETSASMVGASLAVHILRLWTHPMLEVLTTAECQALVLDGLEHMAEQ